MKTTRGRVYFAVTILFKYVFSFLKGENNIYSFAFQVLRYILTGPSSVLTGKINRSTKPCIALKFQIFVVEREMIGYAACQVSLTVL
jgi:hypothetical protein